MVVRCFRPLRFCGEYLVDGYLLRPSLCRRVDLFHTQGTPGSTPLCRRVRTPTGLGPCLGACNLVHPESFVSAFNRTLRHWTLVDLPRCCRPCEQHSPFRSPPHAWKFPDRPLCAVRPCGQVSGQRELLGCSFRFAPARGTSECSRQTRSLAWPHCALLRVVLVHLRSGYAIPAADSSRALLCYCSDNLLVGGLDLPRSTDH